MFMTFVKLNLEIYVVLKLTNQKLKDNAVYVNGRTQTENKQIDQNLFTMLIFHLVF